MDKKRLLEIEDKLYSLKKDRSDLISKNIENVNEVEKLKLASINPKLDINDYDMIRRKVKNCKSMIHYNNNQIKEFNDKIKALNRLKLARERDIIIIQSELKGDDKKIELVKSKLLQLKEKYKLFSTDQTRVSSMRIMSSTILNELEDIIDKI